MSENMSPKNHRPNKSIIQVYKRWAKGGAGLLISGNILVDERYLESAGNVVAHRLSPEEPFKKWTKKEMMEWGNYLLQESKKVWKM